METTSESAIPPLRRLRPGAALAALLALLLPVLAVPACAGTADEPAPDEEEGPPPLVGEVSREEVEAHGSGWVEAEIEASPDAGAAGALLDVEPGAEVVVYLGTWCDDSRRELARLWRAFDEAGIGYAAEPPFDLRYVAVDRDKEQPAALLEGVGLDYVPTFVVRRGGEEVGRVVEISPNGIEHDLLALLRGEASGVVSGRDDLGGGASAEPAADPAAAPDS